MKNFLKTVFIIAYSLIAIIVTVLLLSYNSYMCSYINGYTFYLSQDEIKEEYHSGDLLIIKYTKPGNIKVGDKVFLYKTISTTEYEVDLCEVTEIVNSGTQTIFVVDGDDQYDSEFLIGKQSDTVSVAHLGTVLSILESRWGYLFCIVIITLLLLLQEILDLIEEIKYGKEVPSENANMIDNPAFNNGMQYQNYNPAGTVQQYQQSSKTSKKPKQHVEENNTDEKVKKKTKKVNNEITTEKVKKSKSTNGETAKKEQKKSKVEKK